MGCGWQELKEILVYIAAQENEAERERLLKLREGQGGQSDESRARYWETIDEMRRLRAAGTLDPWTLELFDPKELERIKPSAEWDLSKWEEPRGWEKKRSMERRPRP